ncbi:hypothetical protein DFH06DRAFT_1472559 [Mycena polygramma]|nr:hypothetical protein DFH06DRAFT_1472559 [Mycena polygramma]
MPFHPLSPSVVLAIALATTRCTVQASPTAESPSWHLLTLSHTDRIIAGVTISIGVLLIVIASYFCCCHKACRAARRRRAAAAEKMQLHQSKDAENGDGVSREHWHDASVPSHVQGASINRGNVASDMRSTTTDAPPSYGES